MNVKELKVLLDAFPEETLVGVHNYYDRCGGELLETADGISEDFTDEADTPVIYIY